MSQAYQGQMTARSCHIKIRHRSESLPKIHQHDCRQVQPPPTARQPPGGATLMTRRRTRRQAGGAFLGNSPDGRNGFPLPHQGNLWDEQWRERCGVVLDHAPYDTYVRAESRLPKRAALLIRVSSTRRTHVRPVAISAHGRGPPPTPPARVVHRRQASCPAHLARRLRGKPGKVKRSSAVSAPCWGNGPGHERWRWRCLGCV